MMQSYQSLIKDLIIKKQLGNIIKILTYISDDEVIALYLNSNGVVMPTYCGPTNLPIYESFYFKKIKQYLEVLELDMKERPQGRFVSILH